MNRPSLAGPAMLLAAPVTVIAAVAVLPTVSSDTNTLVDALSAHRAAMIAGTALQTVAIALLIGGAIWLYRALSERGGRLAAAGGFLAVAGSLIPLFEDGVSATGPALTHSLTPAQTAAALSSIHSGVISAIEPLSLVGDLGLALLGVAAVRAGAPRWVAAAVTLGAFAEGAGFGSDSRAVIIAGFAILLAGLAQTVYHLRGTPARHQIAAPVAA